jgi:hypothetical protein
MLSSQAILLSNYQELFYGQGFKTRLDFAMRALPRMLASAAGCDNVYLVFRISALATPAKKGYPSGIMLGLFDRYVTLPNLLRPDCELKYQQIT